MEKITNFETTEIKPDFVELANFKPDVFFIDQIIWEIAFDSFSLSPIYNIGKNVIFEGKGLSLRFPKFKRERLDKDLKSVNDVDHVIDLYYRMKN